MICHFCDKEIKVMVLLPDPENPHKRLMACVECGDLKRKPKNTGAPCS